MGSGEAVDRNELLADVLAEFAHNLGEGFNIQEILDHLVGRIIDVLPVTGAGVMLMGPGDDLHFVAASDEEILTIQTLQNELDEGPCLEAYRSGDPVSIPDLSRDAQFPRFSPGACEAGLAAVFTFPMSLDGGPLGALDLYSRARGAFDEAARAFGAVYAAHAAMALAGAQVHEHDVELVGHLHDALVARDVIGQAKGILMATRHVGPDAAFELLRTTSQHLNVKLRTVAEDVALTGELPEPAE